MFRQSKVVVVLEVESAPEWVVGVMACPTQATPPPNVGSQAGLNSGLTAASAVTKQSLR